MRTPEEFIENFLMHQYDPIDRHGRYLKERELKGRRPASTKPVVSKKNGALHPSVSRKKTPVAPKQSKAAHDKAVSDKVSALQKKLEQLRQVLHDLMLQAKAKGIDPSSSSDSGSSATKASTSTAAEKQAEAKASQKYRDKHKNDPKTPDQQLKEIQSKIDQLNKKIAEMRAKLKGSERTPLQARPQKPGTVGDRTR